VKKDKAENPVIEDAVVEDRQVIEGFVLA
jgi:hypothetical protein